ncbi:MAG: hypothetical protein IKE94_08045 [Aeriscardovia sp.]|nr:hypothetical protein [Aeriscardovia sp.]
MKYNVIKFVTNTKEEYQVQVTSTSETLKAAKNDYFQQCRILNNADDVLYAVIKILDEYGNETAWRETIDNRPEPEPETIIEPTAAETIIEPTAE